MSDSQLNPESVENAYAPPTTAPRTAEESPPTRRFSPHVRGSFKLFAIGVLGIILLIALSSFLGVRGLLLSLGLAACAALFFVAAIRAMVGLYRAPYSQAPNWNLFASLLLFFGSGLMTWLGSIEALWATSGFARGRQIRRFGRVVLPPVEDSDAWTHLPLQLDVPPDIRDALATRWRWNGRTEHASVAAFAQLTLDLMALGAPPSLIHAANRDAKDEIRHTELCFSLARAIDGRDESPGSFPQAQQSRLLPQVRSLALARLAVDSLVDGALHEGLSARVIARLAKQCPEPTIRAVLTEIAADEGRHAAHGWDVVEWCLEQGGESVASALRGAIEALPSKVDTDLPEAARSGAWERYGIHGTAIETEEHAKAREQVVRRVRELTAMKRAA